MATTHTNATAYCSTAAVKKRLPALDSATDSDAVLDDIAEGIEWAQSLIDAKLSARYTVPFAMPVHITLRHIAADLAASMACRLSYSGGGGVTELSKDLYKDAMERLQDLADGETLIEPLPDDQVAEGDSTDLPAYHTEYEQERTLEDDDFEW